MATLSSGYTHGLERKTLRADIRQGKTNHCHVEKIKPTIQIIQRCGGVNYVQKNQQSTRGINFINYPGIQQGVPESKRIQQKIQNTIDAGSQIPQLGIGGIVSFLPNPDRFQQYVPYQLPPCGSPMEYLPNAGTPIPRIPACVAPKILNQ